MSISPDAVLSPSRDKCIYFWRQAVATEPKNMLLQSSLHNQNVSLSSSLCYTRPLLPLKISTSTLRRSVCYQRLSIKCAISKVHSYGTLDYERRPIVRWNDVYRRISLMKNPELGSASVLNQWGNEGRTLTKWELCRIVKELRKYKKHHRALEARK